MSVLLRLKHPGLAIPENEHLSNIPCALSLGHSAVVRSMASGAKQPLFMSCVTLGELTQDSVPHFLLCKMRLVEPLSWGCCHHELIYITWEKEGYLERTQFVPPSTYQLITLPPFHALWISSGWLLCLEPSLPSTSFFKPHENNWPLSAIYEHLYDASLYHGIQGVLYCSFSFGL